MCIPRAVRRNNRRNEMGHVFSKFFDVCLNAKGTSANFKCRKRRRKFTNRKNTTLGNQGEQQTNK